MILKLVGEIRKAFSTYDWSIFFVTYLLAIAAATLLRAVAAIARATVVRLRLVVQAIVGIATSELGLGIPMVSQFLSNTHLLMDIQYHAHTPMLLKLMHKFET